MCLIDWYDRFGNFKRNPEMWLEKVSEMEEGSEIPFKKKRL